MCTYIYIEWYKRERCEYWRWVRDRGRQRRRFTEEKQREESRLTDRVVCSGEKEHGDWQTGHVVLRDEWTRRVEPGAGNWLPGIPRPPTPLRQLSTDASHPTGEERWKCGSEWNCQEVLKHPTIATVEPQNPISLLFYFIYFAKSFVLFFEAEKIISVVFHFIFFFLRFFLF